MARRDDREYRAIFEGGATQPARGPQRGSRVGVERGCIAGRMQPDFYHGLLSPSSGRARLGVPTGSLGKLLELRARDEALRQIPRIVDDRGDNQPLVAVGRRVAVVVLRQDRIPAVWHAVLTQVSRTHVGCDDLQTASADLSASASCSLRGPGKLPLGNRIALPCRLPAP